MNKNLDISQKPDSINANTYKKSANLKKPKYIKDNFSKSNFLILEAKLIFIPL